MKRYKALLNTKVYHLEKIDWLLLLIITIIYGTISFIRLGNTYSPNTFYHGDLNSSIIFDFHDQVTISQIKYFTGVRSASFQIYISDDGDHFTKVSNVRSSGVLKWDFNDFILHCRYIELVMNGEFEIGEIGFFDGDIYLPFSVNHNVSVLNDEVWMIPDQISYMNTSYFDEIYYARSAYEYVFHMTKYEWTHPPLGKLIQTIPIFITHKITPFLYRLMGNISGILLVLVMYLFGLLLFKKRKYALISALLMSLDTFHFSQTRMGTVDSHLVLFITLSIYFMVLFFQEEKNNPLFLSGLFFGLAVSVKWSAFYGGLALAILYFSYIIYYKKFHYKYFLMGFLYFVFIPVLIYGGIYYFFPNNYYQTDNITNIVKENQKMYEYHSTLDDEHNFSSYYITWPISYKPVWLSWHIHDDNMVETISGVGNIVIWYFGIIAMIYILAAMVIKKDKICFVLVITYLCSWFPYAFISRIMFMYHYFPALPFLFLGCVYLLRDIEEIYHLKKFIPIYLVCCLLFFILYYPIVSGMEVSMQYTETLELFKSWTFNSYN